MARRRDRTPIHRKDLYGFRHAYHRSPKIFWEGVCDVESFAITTREGKVGTNPDDVVTQFATAHATYDAYDELLQSLWEQGFRPADASFMSLTDTAVNEALVIRLEQAFEGVSRGRIGIREASEISLRIEEDDPVRRACMAYSAYNQRCGIVCQAFDLIAATT